MNLSDIRSQMVQKKTLSEDEMYHFGNILFTGNFDEDAAKEILIRAYEHGETQEMILGMVKSLRSHALRFPLEPLPVLVDTCGTGGSGKKRFNVSTLVAFVLASLNIHIAKHGNKSTQGRVGSFDILEVLGIPLELTPDETADNIYSKHLGFLYARMYHPSMRFVAQLRQSIPHPTIFNSVGPLSNPAPITHHILGVSQSHLLDIFAECMGELGISGVVVRGKDGSDDISLTTETEAIFVHKKQTKQALISPEEFGIPMQNSLPDNVGSLDENSSLFLNILEPHFLSPYKDLVILNAACMLSLLHPEISSQTHAQKIRDHFDSGAVKAYFQHYRASL